MITFAIFKTVPVLIQMIRTLFIFNRFLQIWHQNKADMCLLYLNCPFFCLMRNIAGIIGLFTSGQELFLLSVHVPLCNLSSKNKPQFNIIIVLDFLLISIGQTIDMLSTTCDSICKWNPLDSVLSAEYHSYLLNFLFVYCSSLVVWRCCYSNYWEVFPIMHCTVHSKIHCSRNV